jgi:hypothetical protein
VDDLGVVDRWSRVITLSAARWQSHVLVRHPELAVHRELVAVTLAEPDFVTRDRFQVDRQNFYRRHVLPVPLAHLALKVVGGFRQHSFDPEDAGFVITAFLTAGVHPKEVQLWP